MKAWQAGRPCKPGQHVFQIPMRQTIMIKDANAVYLSMRLSLRFFIALESRSLLIGIGFFASVFGATTSGAG